MNKAELLQQEYYRRHKPHKVEVAFQPYGFQTRSAITQSESEWPVLPEALVWWRWVYPSWPQWQVDWKTHSSLGVATMAVGDGYKGLWEVAGPIHLRYARRHQADYVLVRTAPPEFPMCGKMYVVYALLERYDRVIWLDSDLLLFDDSIDPLALCPPSCFGFVDERPWLASGVFGRAEEFARFCRAIGVPPPWWAGNAGMVVVPRRARKLFEPPKRMPVYHCAEQDTIFARLVKYDGPFVLLDRRCNWQIWQHDWKQAPAEAVRHWSGSIPLVERQSQMAAVVKQRLGRLPVPPPPDHVTDHVTVWLAK